MRWKAHVVMESPQCIAIDLTCRRFLLTVYSNRSYVPPVPIDGLSSPLTPDVVIYLLQPLVSVRATYRSCESQTCIIPFQRLVHFGYSSTPTILHDPKPNVSLPLENGSGARLLMAVKTVLPLVAFTTFSAFERLLVRMLRLMAFEMIF